jgi:hypothetical protein
MNIAAVSQNHFVKNCGSHHLGFPPTSVARILESSCEQKHKIQKRDQTYFNPINRPTMTGTAVGSVTVNMFLDTVEMTRLSRSESMAGDTTTAEDHGNTKDGNQSCDETMTVMTDDEDDDSKSSGSSSLGHVSTPSSSTPSTYVSRTVVSNSVCGTEVSTTIAPTVKTEPLSRHISTGGYRTIGSEFQKAKKYLNSTNHSTTVGTSFVFTSKANDALRRVRDDRRGLLRMVEVQNSRIRELEAELVILKSEHSLTKLENLLLGGDLKNVLHCKEKRLLSTGGKETDAEEHDNDSCMAQASHSVVEGTIVQEAWNQEPAHHD